MRVGLALLDEILFCVFWILGLLFFWPNVLSQSPWAPHTLYMLLFALLAIAVFGYGLR
jgi:uncharacterized membrane protein